ncbi:MAG: hypothetical protein U1F49_05820 [Rubrivivax sp.]
MPAKLPGADVKLMARLGTTTRMQLYEADLASGLKVELASGSADKATVSAAQSFAFDLVRPGPTVFVEQTKRVISWAALRAERAPEILSQLGPQFEYWSSVAGLGPVMTPYTRELVAAAMGFASHVVQRLKYLLPVPRAMEFSARVQPMIEAPAFFAYPSGHATQAFMVARLLALLLGAGGGQRQEQDMQLYRQAERIATNRVVAGVHYPIDSAAGCALGLWLADYVAARCGGSVAGGGERRTFDPTANGWAIPAAADFEPVVTQRSPGSPTKVSPYDHRGEYDAVGAVFPAALAPDAMPIAWLWQQAAREWHANGYA